MTWAHGKLLAGATEPYNWLRPNILKEVDNFKGKLDDIAHFFSQYKMHFSLFNNYLQYHPHRVIFCVSQFKGEAQNWWNVLAQNLGQDANGNQLYPNYANFKAWVKAHFWQDADEQLKRAQWEKLRQSDFKDRDLFFQTFKQLTVEAGVAGDKLVMTMQIKKAVCATSKTAIFTAASTIPTGYAEWKAHVLQLDYNYCMSKTSAGDHS